MTPNQGLQRLERSGETAKGISLHRMERKAEGGMCPAGTRVHCSPAEASRSNPRDPDSDSGLQSSPWCRSGRTRNKIAALEFEPSRDNKQKPTVN
jgi:hypothetical protein